LSVHYGWLFQLADNAGYNIPFRIFMQQLTQAENPVMPLALGQCTRKSTKNWFTQKVQYGTFCRANINIRGHTWPQFNTCKFGVSLESVFIDLYMGSIVGGFASIKTRLV